MSDSSGTHRVLNLYAGVGGNRALWEDVDVTAVEINEEIAAEYQRQFPGDDVIVADAHEFLLEHHDAGWDFIWSSPPCQSHSRVSYATWHAEEAHNADRDPEYPDMRLYQEVVLLRHFYDGNWVVENVDPYYAELMDAQRAGRHLFWSNFHIPDFEEPARDFELSRADVEDLEDWLGIELTRTIYANGNDPGQVLKNCVHPELGRHVFESREETFQQQTLADARALTDGGSR